MPTRKAAKRALKLNAAKQSVPVIKDSHLRQRKITDTFKPVERPKFPFAKLPAELRQMIYKQALPISTDIAFCVECEGFHGYCKESNHDSHGCECLDDGPEVIVIRSAATLPPEPGLLMVASEVNPELYREALPFFYEKSLINIVVVDFDLRPLTDYLEKLHDNLQRSKMIRRLNVVFEGEMGWENALKWVRTRERVVDKDCQINFTGNSEMIDAFTNSCRIVERLRRSKTSWKLVRSTVQDVDNSLERWYNDMEWAEAGCFDCDFFSGDFDYTKMLSQLAAEDGDDGGGGGGEDDFED